MKKNVLALNKFEISYHHLSVSEMFLEWPSKTYSNRSAPLSNMASRAINRNKKTFKMYSAKLMEKNNLIGMLLWGPSTKVAQTVPLR